MPRTWGYIVLVVAIVIGVGALVLPVPEEIQVEKEEESAATPIRRPATPKAGPRAKKQAAPKPEPLPLQDTTKQRLTNPPTPRG